MCVPIGRLAATTDDEALKRGREEIKRRLLQGEDVVVNKDGGIQPPSPQNDADIHVPPGKLAASFY